MRLKESYRIGTRDGLGVLGRLAMDTRSRAYTQRLRSLQDASWKHWVPNPYRWWLRRQDLGFVLDVGCGLGRSLKYLDGHGIGIDHNDEFVKACREAGLIAFTPDEFVGSGYDVPHRFDSMIMLHVLEHLQSGQDDEILHRYLPFVRDGGRLLLVTPQERGFASDPTHTDFVDGDELVSLCRRHGLTVERWRSFPLPRWAGRLWVYNEFSVVGTVGPRLEDGPPVGLRPAGPSLA
jgi:SAM-dependent methyltransferase